MLSIRQLIIKRSFDVIISVICIIILIVPLLIIFIIATISTKQIGLFMQQRVGYKGKLFTFYKIRTMKDLSSLKKINNQLRLLEKNHITLSGDRRITKFGKVLRKYKVDEIPQLFNVLFGSMSFVGPRPDIKGYADELKGDDLIILNIKPGITGPATLKYRNEELLLSKQKDPLKFNKEVIWRDKVQLNKKYIWEWSFIKDVMYMYKTMYSSINFFKL